MLAATLLLLGLLFQGPGPGQERQGQFPGQQPSPSPTATQGGPQQPRQQPSPTPEEPPVVTKHEIRVGGSTIRYTATAGMMPIKNREGEVEARMFFTSYVVDRPEGGRQRPLTFSFQRWSRFSFRVAAHGRHWSKASEDEHGRRHAVASF